jgi:UDP-N-acetylmuramoyl-tripeptide--D-alanyl-D-alanine ligase
MNIEDLYKVYLQYPSVQTDTRKLKKGDLFFALRGANFNGNEFAAKALEEGAAFAVIDDEQFSIPGKTIIVEDSLEALQLLAKHHRQQFTIPFIAITGSNGKTTTKELIHAVLSSHYKTYTTEGNLNNHIGVPLTLLKIKSHAQFAVIEMGANHLLEIASYCQIALPTYGLITNCGKAHLEGFGGEEGVRKGKGELYDFLRHYNGGAFVMWDYEYLQEMSKGIQTIYKYGTHDADVIGTVWKSDPLLEVQFSKGFIGNIQTKLVGSYNLPNVLAAVAVGKFFGVPDEKIKNSIEAYTPSNSRSQLMQKGSNKIILDAYNANPSSMNLAIENFAKAPGDNKVLVLGAMAELGADSVQEHQNILDTIDGYGWKNVLLIGGDFAKLKHSYIQLPSSAEAGEWLRRNKIKDVYLLIKGSRSTQMEKVLDYLDA